MTSLLMGTMFNNPVPADEKAIRNTATPYDREKPAAMQTDMPRQSEMEVDPDQSVGFGPHNLASTWHQGQPVDSGAWVMPVAQVTESTRIINEQVSTSGTAAKREQAGQVHRDLSYAVGIEPVQGLTENGAFGESYFKTHPRDIQAGSGQYMSLPAGYDQAEMLQATATGKVTSRKAANAAMYDQYLANG
jgi:hypothetical protein